MLTKRAFASHETLARPREIVYRPECTLSIAIQSHPHLTAKSIDLKSAVPAELERRLERQEAAIAQLMSASSPARADSIGEARLHEILRALVHQGQIIFSGRTVTGTAVPLHDPETTAVHHLMLRVADGREIEPTDFAERAFQLHHYTACHLPPGELHAVLLSILPHA